MLRVSVGEAKYWSTGRLARKGGGPAVALRVGAEEDANSLLPILSELRRDTEQCAHLKPFSRWLNHPARVSSPDARHLSRSRRPSAFRPVFFPKGVVNDKKVQLTESLMSVCVPK